MVMPSSYAFEASFFKPTGHLIDNRASFIYNSDIREKPEIGRKHIGKKPEAKDERRTP